jgi:hypothetical protein
MLSRDDFVGKAMLIYAAVKAFERDYLGPQEYAWTLTDCSFLHALLTCNDSEVVDTVNAWLVSDLWPLSELMWFSGPLPTYKAIYEFSNVLSRSLDRHCFAYRIKDKRYRKLEIGTLSGEVRELGQNADRWLLGCVSKKRDNFRAKENRMIEKEACQFFGCKFLGEAVNVPEGPRGLF